MLLALLDETETPPLLALWDQPDALEQAATKLPSLEPHVKELMVFHRAYLKSFQSFNQLVADVEKGSNPEQLQSTILNTAHDWFFDKIHVVEDYYASGDKIIHTIIKRTPFGFVNRVMGLQNIKGTGLDFAYRFLAWDRAHELCTKLSNEDESLFAEALDELMTFRDYGVLSAEFAGSAIEAAKHCANAQKERYQAQLSVIDERFKQVAKGLHEAMSKTAEKRFWLAGIFDFIEGYVDVFDAVYRRVQTNGIYKDLMAQRISRTRAIAELSVLNKRQKGGWLWKELTTFFTRMGTRLERKAKD